MPSSGLPMLSNGSSRMDGTLSQSMDSVNTVAAEEEVNQIFFKWISERNFYPKHSLLEIFRL